jgi:hypothetical protein
MSELESIDQWRFGALMQMVVVSFWHTDEFEDVFGAANPLKLDLDHAPPRV